MSVKILKIISSTSYSFSLHHLPLLTHLYLQFDDWNSNIDHLPSSLIVFRLSGFTVISKLDHLPLNMIHLSLQYPLCFPPLLPSSLSSLVLARADQSTIFPDALTHLRIGQIACPLPSNLTHLHLDNYGSEYPFPHSLQYLQMSHGFDQSLYGVLPPFLTVLVLRSDSNLPVDHLPSSLKSLLISSTPSGGFNRSIDHLPSSLTELDVGNSFNQSVNQLPSSLLSLTFGASFNQPINNLPSSLTDLVFGFKFNQPINVPPRNITAKNNI